MRCLCGCPLVFLTCHRVLRRAASGREAILQDFRPYLVTAGWVMQAGLSFHVSLLASDYIFAPMGGGGMIAGIAAIAKALKPSIQIIGVEPSGANSMTQVTG